MALTPQQTQIARLLYQLAVRHGATPQHAREFVGAAYEESGLQPGINNRAGSGASGLFQLLSSGYVNRANQLGGVHNAKANALAILPDYLRYWQSHPHAAPGQAASAVERSGQGAAFYARHLSFFNTLGGGAAPQLPSPMAQANSPAPVFTPELAQALSAQVGQREPDFTQVLGLIHQHVQQASDQADRVTTAHQPGPQKFGKVTFAQGADRPGVKTSKAVVQLVARIAALAGEALTIGTGTNHSERTVNGNVSDHWSGHAADIPATGRELLRLGRLALIAAGANPRWAMKQRGGLYNIGNHQIIFLTNEGGNHYTHLHVSAH